MSHDWFESSLKYKLMSNSLSNILSNILIACLLLFVFAILPNIFFLRTEQRILCMTLFIVSGIKVVLIKK